MSQFVFSIFAYAHELGCDIGIKAHKGYWYNHLSMATDVGLYGKAI